MSPRESQVVGVLTSILSALLSWFVTHLYSTQERRNAIDEVKKVHEERLKTYALNAVEKVENLSSQMEMVLENLDSTLEQVSGETQTETLLIERLRSVYILLDVLRSTNNTFVTDWRGVIGEELRREEALEVKIQLLRDQLAVQELERDRVPSMESTLLQAEQEILKQIADLQSKKQFSTLPRRRAFRESGEVECCYCSQPFSVNFKASRKARYYRCPHCGQYLNVEHPQPDTFVPRPIPHSDKTIKCPVCGHNYAQTLPGAVGLCVESCCPRCDHEFSLALTTSGPVSHNFYGKRLVLTPKFVALVAKQLPEGKRTTEDVERAAGRFGCPMELIREALEQLNVSEEHHEETPQSNAPRGPEEQPGKQVI